MSEYSREWGVTALAELIITRPYSEWELTDLNAILSTISIAWLKEKTEDLKQDFGAILNSLLPAFLSIHQLSHPKQVVNIGEIRQQVASAEPTAYDIITIIKEIEEWVAEGLNSVS